MVEAAAEQMIALVLFSCLALCLYVYFGYPLLLGLMGIAGRRDVRKADITPAVSIIIPAHNEEKVIAGKLDNLLSSEYPKEEIEIIVASDGSTDRTEEIVSQYGARGVRLLRLSRCGKPMALNEAVALARGEILVFTDANAIFEKLALRHLISNFSDPEVGGVCGDQTYRLERGDDSASEGEQLYWTYDKWIKRLESRLGSVYAADGSIYAIRKHLFVPVTDPAEADDFATSVRVVTQGYRLVFEPGAISYEAPPVSSRREFWRKVRIANQTWRAILNVPEALNPWRQGFHAIELLSHNVLRYLMPFFLPIAFGANVALARGSRVYQLLLLGQGLFYGAALTGWQLRRSKWGRMKLFYGPFYFCLANAAVFLGALSLLSGKRIVVWQPDRAISRARETKERACKSPR
jgi:cellulose synthase/poly-beta-1,6-N-acetylglucosamine synthase-like glycosyltransferase